MLQSYRENKSKSNDLSDHSEKDRLTAPYVSMKKYLQILLVPFARFCLRHGVSLPECIDALKAALLDASVEELNKRKEPVTASRLSLMSGVHRKDSTRFLKGEKPERDTISLSIKVLGAWHTKKRNLTSQRKPKTLSVGTEESEFARLVRDVSADVHPSTILRELERLGLVQVSPEGATPLKSSYISSLNDEGTTKIIARDINDLLLSVEENINSNRRKPNHHTATSYDNIPVAYAAELREWIIKEAGAFHKKVRDHVSSFDRDLSDRKLNDSSKGRLRFVFSSFGRVSDFEGEKDEE